MKTLNEVKWVVHYSDKWGDPVAIEYRADITLTPVAVQKDVD